MLQFLLINKLNQTILKLNDKRIFSFLVPLLLLVLLVSLSLQVFPLLPLPLLPLPLTLPPILPLFPILTLLRYRLHSV